MYTVRTTFRPDDCTVETPAGSQREAFYVARALAAHLAQKKAGRLLTIALVLWPTEPGVALQQAGYPTGKRRFLQRRSYGYGLF